MGKCFALETPSCLPLFYAHKNIHVTPFSSMCWELCVNHMIQFKERRLLTISSMMLEKEPNASIPNIGFYFNQEECKNDAQLFRIKPLKVFIFKQHYVENTLILNIHVKVSRTLLGFISENEFTIKCNMHIIASIGVQLY